MEVANDRWPFGHHDHIAGGHVVWVSVTPTSQPASAADRYVPGVAGRTTNEASPVSTVSGGTKPVAA
jgi:hypothetical protein